MNNYHLDLHGITEARWTNYGKQKTSSGETIIWSGKQDDTHQQVSYALIEDAEEEDKDQFYNVLCSTLNNIPKHDVLLLVEDFNTRVGSKCLTDICEESNLVIGDTLSEHKNIHKLNWTSPDGKTKSQTDHIIINRKW
uniref:Endonuclease/exonuclease/phosphatase domain-containing protein n=1 Tax=Octopus bimaculoides TaxID=37653 RepID=A0A0L8GLK7_OCTBM